MAVFEELKESNPANVWKALNGLGAVAPITAPNLTGADLFNSATGALQALPAAWKQLGRVTEDGYQFARELEVAEIRSHGEADATRRDVRSATKTVSATVQETTKTVLEQQLMMDLSTVMAGANGVVEIQEPDRPVTRYCRLLIIGQDDADGGERYRVRYYPRVNVNEVGEETWNNQDNAIEVPLTWTAYKDALVGFASTLWLGGPGFDAAAAGFTAASADAPEVTGIDPNNGPAAGGTLVLATGSGFAGATGVSFGATPATQFDVIDDSTISVVSPAGSAGEVNVTVTTAAGTSATDAANAFTYA